VLVELGHLPTERQVYSRFRVREPFEDNIYVTGCTVMEPSPLTRNAMGQKKLIVTFNTGPTGGAG
jgi:hypothetical protein